MLKYTTCEEIERSALTINPAKTCQPLGAVYAALGINGCMPHSHGSQGCASYLRMHLSRSFREPIPTTTSSFSEGTAVFGGRANLKEAIRNLIAIYNPKIIAVHTTCVAETIGDDVNNIVEELRGEEELPGDVKIVCASTPSYVGSHITGYANMTRAFAETFARKSPGGVNWKPNGKINLIPGFINPGDIRELKRILKAMDIPAIVFPDTSGVLDSPMTGELTLYPEGGTKLTDLVDAGNSVGTLALGPDASALPATTLEKSCGVPAQVLPVPIGISNVDMFLMKLSEISGKPIPQELREERGRLVDMMIDAHPHFYGKRVAIYGDPDMVVALTSLVIGMGMEPAYVVTGTRSEAASAALSEILKDFPEAESLVGHDLFTMHQKIKRRGVDLLLGNSYGKAIARDEDIPLVRVGFPILDRANLHHFPVVGYAGAARLVEQIGNTLLDRKDRDTEEAKFELIM